MCMSHFDMVDSVPILFYRAKYGIDEMCRDQWNWASKNPRGYGSPDDAN